MAKTPHLKNMAHDAKVPDAPVQGADAPGATASGVAEHAGIAGATSRDEIDAKAPPQLRGSDAPEASVQGADVQHETAHRRPIEIVGGSGGGSAPTFIGGLAAVERETSVILLPNGRERSVSPGSLIITCSVPGFRRAGVAHPHYAIHSSDRFSEAEINLLRNESKLTVIRIG